MIVHKTPELRIHEVHHDHIVVYDNMDDWVENGSNNYGRSHLIRCLRCKAAYMSTSQFAETCIVSTKIYNFSGDNTHRSVPHKDGHHLVYTVVIRDEFGYNFTLDELAEASDEYYEKRSNSRLQNRELDYYHGSYINPNNRGLLEIHHPDNNYYRKYRHALKAGMGGYRQIRTMNERRQVAAGVVDEYSPAIRPNRNVRNLPNSWDDLHYSLERTWKRSKHKKQWMVNL